MMIQLIKGCIGMEVSHGMPQLPIKDTTLTLSWKPRKQVEKENTKGAKGTEEKKILKKL